MGGNPMSKMNLEIIDYIQKADFDDGLKQFFIKAIIFEKRNPNVSHFTATYENMIESSMTKNGDE